MKTKVPEMFKQTDIEKEVLKHYPIKLKSTNYLTLFCLNRLSILKKCVVKPVHKRLLRLYDNGQERLEDDLSGEKLVKHIRDIKCFIKNQFLDE